MKYGENVTLSKFPDVPNGFEEPAPSCNEIKCIKIKAAKITSCIIN